jgi:uncharacterized protein (DUF58 family)
MQTLIPQSASATARPKGRFGRWAAFGLTARALLLFSAGLLLAIPAFWQPRRIGFMLAWDALLIVVCLVDAARLPRPESITVTRRFLDSPQLGEPTRIELALRMDAEHVIEMRVVDDLHPALVIKPEVQRVEVFPREEAVCTQTIWPGERGDFAMGAVYLRCRGALQLVERWAVAEPLEAEGKPQRVRVFPTHEDSRGRAAFFLLRARQIELQRRKLQLRGSGREFESLRDFQQGDELRSISWTATARRGKLVARQFTAERSQQVWVVLDAGRLSRTAFELRRGESELVGETVMERDRAHRMSVMQLDQATTAAVMLAQVVGGSGDKFAMMAYGRDVKQVLPPGAGVVHRRLLLDLLSQTRAEAAEADHLNAVARLKTLQRRRGLIVWITELVDSAGKPELVTAASELVRRHLVVLVLLRHPELEELAARVPKTREEMFHSAAAQEMLERRRDTIAQLERQGVLIVETTAEEIGVRTVSEYLEVKARGLL